MKNKILLSMLMGMTLVVMTGCGDLEPRSKDVSPAGTSSDSTSATDTTASEHDAATDEAQDETVAGQSDSEVVLTGPAILASSLVFTDTLFGDYKWYSYNLLNHRVYPLFDVYAIRSNSGQYYKVQIIDYYSKTTQEAAHYELRVQRPDGRVTKLHIAAVGCGDPIGGVVPECDEHNTYVFLNLDTEAVTHMSPEEAILVADWDLGFKRTDVLLNSPSVGVGQTQGALLYRNENFFGAFGFAKYDLLMDAYVKGGEEKAFNDAGYLVP